MGRFAEAQQQLRQALQLDPASISLTFGLGNSFRMQRQYDQAIAEFKKVVAIEPSNPQAHLFLCWAYRDKGMHNEAAEELQASYLLTGFPVIAAQERKAYARSGWKGMLVKDIEVSSNPGNQMTVNYLMQITNESPYDGSRAKEAPRCC